MRICKRKRASSVFEINRKIVFCRQEKKCNRRSWRRQIFCGKFSRESAFAKISFSSLFFFESALFFSRFVLKLNCKKLRKVRKRNSQNASFGLWKKRAFDARKFFHNRGQFYVQVRFRHGRRCFRIGERHRGGFARTIAEIGGLQSFR